MFPPNVKAPTPTIKPRPALTAETVVEYLDWICAHLGALSAQHVQHHLTAAELAIRTRMGEAQAKDTQHTLVRDGLVDAPAL